MRTHFARAIRILRWRRKMLDITNDLNKSGHGVAQRLNFCF